MDGYGRSFAGSLQGPLVIWEAGVTWEQGVFTRRPCLSAQEEDNRPARALLRHVGVLYIFRS